MAHVERRRQTSGLEEEPSPLDVSPSTPLALLIALLMSAAGMVWHRKRQFDRKGYHKKKESDLSECA
jgi:cell division protein FtsL